MPDSVKSLKKSKGELKRQLEHAKKELKNLEQRVTNQECMVRNVKSEEGAAAILNRSREAEASLEFVNQEFDDTKLQLEGIRESLANIKQRLTNFEERLLTLEFTFNDIQNHSYSFKFKVLGVPELSDSESAADTSLLLYDYLMQWEQYINIAHRVPPHDLSRGGPRPIICNFTRRLVRNEVMILSKEANKISAAVIGFDEDRIMSNPRVVEHLTPRLQKLFVDVKAFKNQYQYAFCWVKNGSILLRKTADSHPVRVKSQRMTADQESRSSYQLNATRTDQAELFFF
ncbi:uncharacterized protein LOC111343274 [Stylophora pistillata]|uniref:uncharacterized protein LOC111343274 n=1 Tax=Stylophora pistillata TaxID=50429 RepID=UPI000C03D4F2|nr:uncharacterized protein LOC111343274 [Stylophora pistillata]